MSPVHYGPQGGGAPSDQFVHLHEGEQGRKKGEIEKKGRVRRDSWFTTHTGKRESEPVLLTMLTSSHHHVGGIPASSIVPELESVLPLVSSASSSVMLTGAFRLLWCVSASVAVAAAAAAAAAAAVVAFVATAADVTASAAAEGGVG